MSTKETYKYITDVDELHTLVNALGAIPFPMRGKRGKLYRKVLDRWNHLRKHINTFRPHPSNKIDTFAKFGSN